MFSLKLYMLPNLLSHIIGCDTLTHDVEMGRSKRLTMTAVFLDM
jgi:hypothetical protein